MGVSTNAILFYGYCWNEEDVRNPWEISSNAEHDTGNTDEEDDWEERYARAMGCLPPSTPYPTSTERTGKRRPRSSRPRRASSTPTAWPHVQWPT